MKSTRSAAVDEWARRKADHAEDPLPAAQARQRVAGFSCSSSTRGTATARLGGVVVACSQDVVKASGRLYFPLKDCDLRRFAASGKRWR